MIASGNVVAGLVDALRAADGFRAPSAAGADVPVFDGAIVGGGSVTSSVVVGGDGEPDGVQRPVSFQSGWHDLGLTMDEQGSVQCSIVVWSGDANPDTFATQRSTAYTILADVDAAIRSSVTAAALGVNQLLWCHIASGDLIQGVTSKGARTNLQFTVAYQALLVGP